jgi:glycosyltransferase involved in cell wall biosynthesis
MQNPRVSVIMSVYNGEKYLREAIDSILNQTFKDFEFLIIDDGSTDSSAEIVHSYCDPRIRVFKQENKGLTKSLNIGLKLANGEYIARQDADDISLPFRLEKQVEFLDKQTDVVLVSSNIEFMDDRGESLGKSDRATDSDLIAWYLLFYNQIGGHSQVMFRNQPVMKLGGYSEALRCTQDYELWVRLAKSHEIAILPDVLVRWRKHDDNISVKNRDEQKSYGIAISSKRLAELTGRELDSSQVSELKDFWKGRSPNSCNIGSFHSSLKRIYDAFLQERMKSAAFESQLPLRLQTVIGEQFVECVKTLSKPHHWCLMLKISFYAFKWHPLGIVKYWLTGLLKVPLRVLTLLKKAE